MVSPPTHALSAYARLSWMMLPVSENVLAPRALVRMLLPATKSLAELEPASVV